MILIWKGLGFLVPVALFIGGVISISIFKVDNAISNSMVFVFMAVTCYVFDVLVKKIRSKSCEITTLVNQQTGKEQTYCLKHCINKKTGESYKIIVKDTFFGLSMFSWIFISLIFGVISFIAN